MIKQINEAKQYIISQEINLPKVGVILGTGLGKFIDEMDVILEIAYDDIPHFPTATVEYHAGKLVFGAIADKTIVVMQGRFHLYEGYNLQEITFPVRVLKALGVETLLVSNAAGAINLDYNKGELMLIEDHINLQGGSPLAFKGAKELGEQFVDMSQPYDLNLIGRLQQISKRFNIHLNSGVYASVVGPQLETRAEYKMLKILGADAVGMSTVPEIIVANQLGLKSTAISVLTDECNPADLHPINIPEIMEIVAKAEPQMITLFKELISELSC